MVLISQQIWCTNIIYLGVKACLSYTNLGEVVNLEEKEAFDKCIEIRVELKDIYLKVSPVLPRAKNLVERMIMFSEISR